MGEALIKAGRTIVSLMREVDDKDREILEMEHRYNDTVASMHGLIVRLTEKIKHRDRSLLAMQNKYNESLAKVRSLDELREGYHKEIKKVKIMNHDMESLKKEFEKVTKELEETKALNDLQQRNSIEEIEKVGTSIAELTENINSKERRLLEMERKCNESSAEIRRLMDENDKLHEENKEIEMVKVKNNNMTHVMKCLEKQLGQAAMDFKKTNTLNKMLRKCFMKEIEELKRKLQDQNPAESHSNLNTQINTLKKELDDKMEDMDYLESCYNVLLVSEHKYREEVNDAREESINCLQDMLSGRCQLGIKRMGELDQKPFQDVCLQIYSREMWPEISAQLCSSWEAKLKNPHWHPFKKEIVNELLKETIDENDENLKGLREEYGVGVYKAVVNALMELEEYNPSGRYAVPEIWNWKEGRRASLKEIIAYFIRQLKSHKRRKKF